MSARRKAEAKAVAIAGECQQSGHASRRCVEGTEFAAIGGWDPDGLWHFAVEFATEADRADVREWMRATA